MESGSYADSVSAFDGTICQRNVHDRLNETVQELLGHSTIITTMRYARFAASHASRSILEAQRLEQREIAGDKQATPKPEQESSKTRVPANVLESMPGTGVEPVRPLRGPGF